VPPLSRLGPGAAGAGAALGATSMELFVTCAFLFSIGRRVVDRRNAYAIGASLGVCLAVVAIDRLLWPLGFWRLLVDPLAYVVLVLTVRAVRLADIRAAIGLISARRKKGAGAGA
jgi:hypothetical protein